MKFAMTANIIKTQIFYKIMYDLRPKVTKGHLKMPKLSFSAKFFCLTPYLLKPFQECQYYEDANFSLNEVEPQRSSKVI